MLLYEIYDLKGKRWSYHSIFICLFTSGAIKLSSFRINFLIVDEMVVLSCFLFLLFYLFCIGRI